MNCAGAGQPGRVWQARPAQRVAMLPGEAGINVRKTARYAGKDCDPLHGSNKCVLRVFLRVSAAPRQNHSFQAESASQNMRSCFFRLPRGVEILATVKAKRHSLREPTLEPMLKLWNCTLNPQQLVLYVTWDVVYWMAPWR